MEEAAATAFDRPDHTPPVPDGVAIEAAIRRAIDEGRRDLVDIVGAGELTIALRWTSGEPPCVVKRMPPYPDRASAEKYMAVVRDNIARLEALGVRCVSNTMQFVERADGKLVVIHCQPLLDASTLADHVLPTRTPSADEPLVTTLVDRVVAAVSDGEPIDPQFANWCWFEDDLWLLDLSTPFVMEGKDIVYDTSGFQREFPWLIRRMIHRELMKLAVKYTNDVEYVLTDVMTQLHRSGMSDWCQPFADAALARHGIVIDPAVAKQRCDADANFYPFMLRTKRFERRWRQLTRRRYDALLPEKSTFG
ncbi:MAG: DUF6206 family protein [Gammaproteobacteria bacterium]